MTATHVVIPQTDGIADHAAPEPLTLAQYDAMSDNVVEPKVRAATAAATAVSFVLWVLGAYVFDGIVPLPVQGFVGLVVTGACTLAAGYLVRHVDRA